MARAFGMGGDERARTRAQGSGAQRDDDPSALQESKGVRKDVGSKEAFSLASCDSYSSESLRDVERHI